MSASAPALAQRVRALGAPRVGIVGDLILDRYLVGEVQRISPEAPIQILEERLQEDRLGGAGNVAANLAAMGARTRVVGVVGRNDLGRALVERLVAIGAHVGGVVRDPSRPTSLKTRLVAGVQQVLRVDREKVSPVGGKTLASVLAAARALVRASDVVVLSDYGKGVVVEPVIRAVVSTSRAAGRKVLVDPKARDFSRYRGAHLVTPNRAEAEQATGIVLSGERNLRRAADALIRAADLEAVVITLGKDGLYYRTRGGVSRIIPTEARQVFDVTGAGDTIIGHLALHLGAGAPLEEALRLANVAAGIVVGKLGAASVSRGELLARLEPSPGPDEKVVPDRAGLDRLAAAWRREGKRIVFTNGCFDLLHSGHVALLQAARARGDVLVVGVNDDVSVKRLKGRGRPVNPLGERMAVLAGLASVDAVVPFEEDTPLELVRRLSPDVLVKGADWEGAGVVGREWVESRGGSVVLESLKPGVSTSATIRKIAGRNAHPRRGVRGASAEGTGRGR